MTIVREFGINDNKKLRYKMINEQSENLKSRDGQRFGVLAYVLFEDTNRKTGELTKILKVLDEEHKLLGTGSAPFIQQFENYLTCMETDECTEMGVASKRSANNRDYLCFIA